MTFNTDQMNRQMNFSLTLSLLERLYKEGILTKSEFAEEVRKLRVKYNPIIGYKS